MVSWLARFRFFNARPPAVRPRAPSTLGIDGRSAAASPREGRPDGQVLAARQRALQRAQVSIDFVGRQLALVRHLRASSWPSPSLGLVRQGPQLRHRVHRRRGVPRHAAGRPGHPGRRRRPARGGRRHRHRRRRRRRSSPPPATRRSWSRPSRSPTAESETVVDAILRDDRASTRTTLSQSEIGASWGQEVAERALLGLVVFLVLVVLFIWAYFREWKMSVAALVALAHDSSSPSASTRCPASR